MVIREKLIWDRSFLCWQFRHNWTLYSGPAYRDIRSRILDYTLMGVAGGHMVIGGREYV